MNKAVMISIQPYYVFLIIAHKMGWDIPQEKTIEVRKNYPKDSAWDKRTYIYCSQNRKSFNRIPTQYQPFMAKFLGKVVGVFVCDRIEYIIPDYNPKTKKFFYGYVTDLSPTCLSEEELQRYAGITVPYFWHITDLKIYDKPKELREFEKPCRFPYHCRACECSKIEKTNDGFEYKCYRDFRLEKPFQSWGYVEET